jgi:hypothetical protein
MSPHGDIIKVARQARNLHFGMSILHASRYPANSRLDSRGRLSPQELVAAGVVLVGDQHQARADGDWFRL